MYQSIFDYESDFNLFSGLLAEENCKKILEIGCGSGNLIQYFSSSGFDYTGLDISEEILSIAKQNNPEANLIQGDMRNIKIASKFDAVIITGRSFTYMTTNNDVIDALKSIKSVLNDKGILIFDNFDANIIFRDFQTEMIHESNYNNRTYKRVSKNSINLETGWTWNWEATYYIKENEKTEKISDKTILRAFLEDELNLFLNLNDFKIKKIVKDGPSLLIVAQKKNE
jgi:SAM-dependent methyltransferase